MSFRMATEVQEQAAIPLLEVECERCHGSGSYLDIDRLRTCPDCDGVGSVPTQFGMDVFNFVWRRLENIQARV